MKLHKSLLLFGATALALVGCADDGETTETQTIEEPETEEVTEEVEIKILKTLQKERLI